MGTNPQVYNVGSVGAVTINSVFAIVNSEWFMNVTKYKNKKI